MIRRPPLPVIVAALVSVPLVAVALAGAATIAWSLATESWYRSMFGSYGLRLLTLYVFYAAGVVAAAAIALGHAHERGTAFRVLLASLAIAGIVAAIAFEHQFWSEADRFLPRGATLLPFACWGVAALFRDNRSRPRAPQERG